MKLIEKRLADCGHTLPTPAAPVASYVPFTVHHGTIYISGQLPFVDGRLMTGTLGDTVDIEEGVKAAEACALMVLAQVKAACEDDFERLERCLKLSGFVASTPDFKDHPKVINGASELIGLGLGEAGRHARAAVGVSSLPLRASVEVEAIFALKQ